MTKACLISNFEKKGVALSNVEREIIMNTFQTKLLKKKEYLLEAGTICDFEAFVVQGCFRVFCVDETGEEHIVHFSIEDWWLADLESYNFNKPSKLYIQALEDSEILIIHKKDKEELYTKVAPLERIYRIMTQQECVALQRRIVNELSMTGAQKYDDFCERYPLLVQRLTNIQIASYLGITQEFLSKIRKKRI